MIREVLYWIHEEIWSQWSWRRTGVMWLDFLVLVTSLAAVFCMHWNLDICDSSRPQRILLQESRREVTDEWTNFLQSAWFKYFRIRPMLWIAKEPLLQMLLTCEFSVRWLSDNSNAKITCSRNWCYQGVIDGDAGLLLARSA